MNSIAATDQDMEALKQPIKIHDLEIHNRLVMAPMECRKTDEASKNSWRPGRRTWSR